MLPQAFSQRILCDQVLKLADQLESGSDRQIGRHPCLRRTQTQFMQVWTQTYKDTFFAYTGRQASGKEIAIPGCMVCKVESGRITRLDEYLDSAQTAELRG